MPPPRAAELPEMTRLVMSIVLWFSAPAPEPLVENHDTMDLTNVVISGNSAALGGGIYNAGTLTLTNVVVTENTSLDVGGGIHNDRGTMFMSNVTVTGNLAGTGGG